MATVSTLYKSGTTHLGAIGSNVKVPYLVEFELDWADALAAKGSALANADVIECIHLPAQTVVLGAGLSIKTTGNATALTVDLGVTGVDADEWANDFDIVGTAGTHSADLSASPVWYTAATADTIDVVLVSLTGTISTGVTRVYALLLDVSDTPSSPGIALIGS